MNQKSLIKLSKSLKEELEKETMDFVSINNLANKRGDVILISEELLFKTATYNAFDIVIGALLDEVQSTMEFTSKLRKSEGFTYLLQTWEDLNILDRIWKLVYGLGVSSFTISNEFKLVDEICKLIEVQVIGTQKFSVVSLWPGFGYELDQIKVYEDEVMDLSDHQHVLEIAICKILYNSLNLGQIITEESDKELFAELETARNNDEEGSFEYFDLSFYDLGIVYLMTENLKIE